MTAFVLISTALAAGILLILLLPLLRARNPDAEIKADATNLAVHRDQLRELDNDLAAGVIDHNHHQEARLEIERRLLDDTASAVTTGAAPGETSAAKTAVLLAIVIPIAATGIYLITGNPEGLSAESAAQPSITPQQVEQMIEKLAQRLKAEPGDAEGWAMMGRSHAVMGRINEAVSAYARAVELQPRNAAWLIDFADVLALSRDSVFAGEPEQLVRRALAIEPENSRALAMAGTAEFENRQYAAAVKYWERLLALLPPGTEVARSVESSIKEARGLAAVGNNATNSITQKAGETASRGAPISGRVRISDALISRVAPEDTVFIFARAAEGPAAPLAVIRRRGADLPLEFTLDDSMAMTAGRTLTTAGTLVIGARVSKSGNAGRRPGDLEGYSPPVNPGAANITIVIDRVAE